MVTAAGSSSGGSVFLGIAIIVALVAVYAAYNKFKERGFRERQVSTGLTAGQLAEIFEQKVCGMGWKIVDRGNPLVAQSSLAAGIRQQIALQVSESGGRSTARIWVPRYSKKLLGGTTKAYTLRLRMSGFLNEVQRRDAAAVVAG